MTRLAPRNVGYCLQRLTTAGILECIPMYGGYRYRCQQPIPKAAQTIVAQLDLISRVLKQA
jgi:hypothetical protein